jgi:mono/diheme cytochrome c family protein
MKLLPVFIFSILLAIGCKTTENNTDSAEQVAPQNAEKLYKNHCSICHGDDGKLGFSGAKDLSKTLYTPEEIIGIIKSGSKNGKMRAFGKDAGGELNSTEIKTIAEYLKGFKTVND